MKTQDIETTPSRRRSSWGTGTRCLCWILWILVLVALAACTPDGDAPDTASTERNLLLTNARVYTFDWPAPAPDGTPAAEAPRDAEGWQPDAQALLIRDGRIAWVGSAADAESRTKDAQVLDLGGATVLPGLVDAHTHVRELGARLGRVDLVGADDEATVLTRLRESASEGDDWLIGWGWDEGAWAAAYPDWDALSQMFPERPVALYSLHGFALWANRAAFAAAGVDESTVAPTGGELVRDAEGKLTGILLNRATTLVRNAVPEPSQEQIENELRAGLEEMVRSGYVAVHEAGLDGVTLAAYEALEARDELPIRVLVMLSARDQPLMEHWIDRGPRCDPEQMLRICTVKAYWDGALGSRGARLLDDYSDRPGHRGVSGDDYGFDQELVARAAGAGFQLAIHAIGDAGNRETLDYLEGVLERFPDARGLRHRVEHAQVLHPDDFARFAALDLVASMQPPHVAEDQAWAEERLGPARIVGAYAWRTFAELGVPVVFSSDLAGSDHDLFYGLHSATTRRPRPTEANRDTATDGFTPDQAFTMEEAIRAYSEAAAFASFLEDHTGAIRTGAFADLTVIDLDPLQAALEPGAAAPAEWWESNVRMTIVGGTVRHDASP